MIRALVAAVAAGCGLGVLGSALTVLLCGRLMGAGIRMERLAGRFVAGTLRRFSGGAGSRGRGVAAGSGRSRRGGVFPGGFAWLVRLMGWRVAGYGLQLRAILVAPEMVALLAAAPQAGRILRPMCRMLGVETALLRPGRATVAVRAAGVADGAAPAPRLRVTRAVVEGARIALPRGLLSAARRQGFGKLP